MKTRLPLLVALISISQSFSATILSYQSTGSTGSDTAYNMGQQFVMGGTSYQLSSVTVPVVSGWAHGTNGYLGPDHFSLGLFADNAGQLGERITDLTYSSFDISIPELGLYQYYSWGYNYIANVTFTAPNTVLNANTSYWIAPTVSSGLQAWIQVMSPFTSLGDATFGLWEVNGHYYGGRAFGLTIAGNAVPEPSTYALLGLGLGGILLAVRRKRLC
jgi:hypothetical protein